MKKGITLILSLVMAVTLLAGCGASGSEDGSAESGDTAEVQLSGAVALNGSTSMEKVVGVLGEQFMADNQGVSVTYDATGSGAGIQAVLEGRCNIGLSSRNLKAEETAKAKYERLVKFVEFYS